MSIHALHPNHPRPRLVTWPGLLEACSTELEVIAVARDFLATLSHEEFASLPEDARPPKLLEADDVTGYAFTLVRLECDSPAAGTALLERMAAFFSSASIRLAQVLTASGAPGNRQSA